MKIVRILSICSIFLGLSSVAYSEVAPTTNSVSSNRVSRNSASRTASTSSSRTATRNTANNRAVVSRTAVAPTITNTVSGKTTASRSATTRTTSGRKTVSRSAINTTTGSSNSSRTTATRTTGNTRNVSSRTGTNNRTSTARVGMVTSSGTSSSRYARLTTATNYNLNELIDSTTGYISDNAYDTCKENYFECMDLVCTVRSTDKGRCACSDRIKAYTEIEADLEAATLELLEVSNSLTLLIASGGDAELMSAAFSQSDAEEVLTCVSGCNSNSNFECSFTNPDLNHYTCATLNGSDSDIITQLQNIATALEGNETSSTTYAWSSLVSELENDLNTATGMNISNDDAADAYANKWGLELLEFADPGYKTNVSPYTKSNAGVCSRVIDMCFNGIANSWSEAQKSNAYSSSTSYTDSTEPYAKYRTPIKNARGSIRNLYAFNANAACDSYGETLKKKLQNIKTQVISAKALLQQKRLGFKQTAKSDITTRLNNWNNCYTEAMEYIQDYYDEEVVTRSAFAVAMNNSSYCSLSMPLVNGEEMTSISTRLYQRYKCEKDCGDDQICEWIVTENKCDKENTVTVSGSGASSGDNSNTNNENLGGSTSDTETTTESETAYEEDKWYNTSDIEQSKIANSHAFYYVWNGNGATDEFSTKVQYLKKTTVASYR